MQRTVPTSEIRKDYVQEKYVIIAPRRSARPRELECPECVVTVSAADCFFCPARSNAVRSLYTLPAKRSKGKWRVKVLPNKFPTVSHTNPKAYGSQEVVIETPDHELQLERLPTDHVADLLGVYAQRIEAITADPRIQYVIIFKNTSGRAGASVHHSHSQIFATDFIPPHLLDKSQKAFEYRLRYGTCVYCDVVAREAKGPRLVWRDDKVVVFTPYASMHNYELWILPWRHIDNITALDEAERRSWAASLTKALAAIVKLGLPYNFYCHQVVRDTDQHFYMKITPRGSVWAGVEIGSGVIINPVSPEDAAAYYRREFKRK